MDFLQGFNSDYLIGKIQVHVFPHPDFKGIGFFIGISPPGEQSAFDAFREVRISRADVPRLAGLPEDFPKSVSLGTVQQVDLVSSLFGPS